MRSIPDEGSRKTTIPRPEQIVLIGGFCIGTGDQPSGWNALMRYAPSTALSVTCAVVTVSPGSG